MWAVGVPQAAQGGVTTIGVAMRAWILVLGQGPGEQLDGDALARLPVLAQVHQAHAAGAEQVLHEILADGEAEVLAHEQMVGLEGAR